jgi:hypothetical protein
MNVYSLDCTPHLLVSIGSSLFPKLTNLATVIDERQQAPCLLLHIEPLVFPIGLHVLKVQQRLPSSPP